MQEHTVQLPVRYPSRLCISSNAAVNYQGPRFATSKSDGHRTFIFTSTNEVFDIVGSG